MGECQNIRILYAAASQNGTTSYSFVKDDKYVGVQITIYRPTMLKHF